MEIKLTDEQIEKLVEKTVRDYILQNFKKKIDDVMKSKYHFQQNISDEMKKAIVSIMEEKVENSLSNRELSEFVDVDKVSQAVADRVLERVSNNISDAIRETFY